jgi:sulfur transfer complex TusBCD TusB component (DsrH family)
MISELAKQKDGLNLILLSDAVFLLNDPTQQSFFDEIEKYGANLFVTSDDIEKRNPLPRYNHQILSYESLVELLLSEQTISINL